MKYIAIFVGFILCVMGGIGLGSSGAPFNYDEATREQQHDWLERQSKSYVQGVKSKLGGFGGVGSSMLYDATNISPSARTIESVVVMTQDGYLAVARSTLQRQLNEQVCPKYVDTQLAKNRVTLINTIKNNRGGVMLKLKISMGQCKRYVKPPSV